MLRMVHIAQRQRRRDLWTPVFVQALQSLGEFQIIENAQDLPTEEAAARLRDADVLLTGWASLPTPIGLLADPGRLRYICNVTGSVRPFVPREFVASDIPVTNWGDAPADEIAEGALTLLMAVLRDLHLRIMTVRQGGGRIDSARTGGQMRGLRVAVYGCGVIGRRFIEMLAPFGCQVTVFDPYAEAVPSWCRRVSTLRDLCVDTDALVIHAGLTEATRKTVTAELLALLPDHGIVVNTARGGIVDQEALFAELASGRLRAGLDVLEPDTLPADHPARQWENLIWTAHRIGGSAWPEGTEIPTRLANYHGIALDNLRRFVAGQELLNRITLRQYDLMT